MTPSGDQLSGVLRTVLAAAAGWAAAKGYGDAATDTTIAGAVGVIIVAGWSLYTNRRAKVVAVPSTGPAVATTASIAGPIVQTITGPAIADHTAAPVPAK